MMTEDTTSGIPSKRATSALQMGPHKKVWVVPTVEDRFNTLILPPSSSSDPLISHGRHFGRTVFALCNYPSLLTNGVLRLEQMEETPLEHFSAEWKDTTFIC
jgi:hypothetical protein